MTLILIDTHILLWLFDNPYKLSESLLDQVYKNDVFVSSISAWEISMKIQQNKLSVGEPVRKWWVEAVNQFNLRVTDVNTEILITSNEINWEHRDPADRIIVATALIENLRLATHDKRIINSNLVEVVN